MASPSFREQQLLIEFATFRATPLPGTYLSLHPTNPAIWYGVLFLRPPASSVYSGVPVRFIITFPKSYPQSPPFVVVVGEQGGSGAGSNTSATGVVRHPLVARGGGAGGRGMAAGYAGAHAGAVNLRGGFPVWFEPKSTGGGTPATTTGGGGGGGGGAPAGAGADGAGAGATGTTAKTTVFPTGTSPVEVVYYLRGMFTDRYLSRLQARLDSDSAAERAIIVDEEAWRLWKEDHEGLKRLVAAEVGEEAVFGEWDGGGEAPIRFLDLQREALDTIKENLGRRVIGGVSGGGGGGGGEGPETSQ